jgi:uncharacterized protein (DUF2252 family)
MNDKSGMADSDPVKIGRALREKTPRLSLGTLSDRSSDYDVVARLSQHDATRVASLVPLRYKRMLESPFAFYRGAALLMADDLARSPSTSLEVQICGDAHISNFGVFSSPERQMVFDVNDFDETTSGPFEWDVKRMVASLAIASKELGHSSRQQEYVALEAAREYRTSMQQFSTETRLDVWYSILDPYVAVRELRGFFSGPDRQKIDDIFRQVRAKNLREAYAEVIDFSKDSASIKLHPPQFSALSDGDGDEISEAQVIDIVAKYASTLSYDRQVLLGQFRARSAVRHVVGVGSVGTQCLAVLLLGRDEHDPLLLQVKEARTSVIDEARGISNTLDPGERVVRGQRLMQVTSDALLGWHTSSALGRSFYVRQLYDAKASVAIERLDLSLLAAYGRLCAWTLARSHARSGRASEITGYLGKGDRFDEALASFALAYQERNQSDYDQLVQAVKQGRISAS